MNTIAFILSIVSVLLSLIGISLYAIPAYNERKKKIWNDKVLDISNNDTQKWLLNYHRDKNNLYKVQFINSLPIAFLTDIKDLKYINLKNCDKPIMTYDSIKYRRSRTPKQEKLIEERIKYRNQRLFNDRTLCLSSENSKDGEICYSIVEYYDLAANVIEYEEELYKAIIKKKCKTPLRDAYLSDIHKIKEGIDIYNRKISVGAAVVFCFKIDKNKYKVLLKKRSNRVITQSGMYSVIPQFGFEPTFKVNAQYFSTGIYKENGIVIYNIIKESVEELFNKDILIKNINNTALSDKFIELEDVQALKKSFENESLKIIYLGSGYGALVGTNTLAFLLLVDDVTLSKKLLNKVQTNWEFKKDLGDNADIENIILDIQGLRLLNTLIEQNEMTSTAAFSLDRAIEWLKKENYI